ncbi:Os05g0433500 [Oryza sativa Japonica Group]|uniref:Os05g0433500 protein n=1 Tax=Oryza sativa subsp. japonica TaxID=39947 RepID=A0A0P0WMT9_ORYSJ|nr:hypothetical protein EE612_029699 [Oryza sativa]BAS94179.1 Os05g0433500 [Oryza sativa Japonica Group]
MGKKAKAAAGSGAGTSAGREEPIVVAIKMDKTTIIVSSVVGSLGVLSAILGFAAEAAKFTILIINEHNDILLCVFAGLCIVARVGDRSDHLPDDGAGHRCGRRRLLRVLQVPCRPVRDQADRRRRVRLDLMKILSRYLHPLATSSVQGGGGDRVCVVRGRINRRGGGVRRPGRRVRGRGRAGPRRHGPRDHLVYHAPYASAGRRGGGRPGGPAGLRRRRTHADRDADRHPRIPAADAS